MKKLNELGELTSAWNRAGAEELVFILLGRDKAAPNTIRFWCEERVRQGKNEPGDKQLVEALSFASYMEQELKKGPPAYGEPSQY